jgi:hypothetical protein
LDNSAATGDYGRVNSIEARRLLAGYIACAVAYIKSAGVLNRDRENNLSERNVQMTENEDPQSLEIATLSDDDLDSASGGLADNTGTGKCIINSGTGTCSGS